MKIEHVAIYVHDLDAARDFFIRYFGATAGEPYYNGKTGLQTYFLTLDRGARLELMTRPEMAARSTAPVQAGLTHLAFGAGSREAVNALTERLSNDGYTVVSAPRVTGDGYYESCVLGPEGVRLEITI
ncbi:MAG: VOC family protein [Eubacteriales bacterium]|nr:VOC family protein [Eubacteriales bacterium]